MSYDEYSPEEASHYPDHETYMRVLERRKRLRMRAVSSQRNGLRAVSLLRNGLRREGFGRGIVPISNPKERLVDDRRRHPLAPATAIPSAITSRLKKTPRPLPSERLDANDSEPHVRRSPILEKSGDADYYLDSVQAKLEELHNDFVELEKQYAKLSSTLDEKFHRVFLLLGRKKMK
jgi:hypothetical protein